MLYVQIAVNTIDLADIWVHRLQRGWTTHEIARHEGLSVRRVQQVLEKRRADIHELPPLPRLVPFYPITSLTPQSACPHHGPIRHGSVLYCEVCGQSGLDDHPALWRDPRTDPSPERKPEPEPCTAAPETRRQRRKRLMRGAAV